ncbi:MAG: hypothetical protein J3Q66DRAFT_400975 [Benniella sp.]|nr:MAG: hypothetical protein J3Q66DRAFT_400975 [Benniella sp.]
MIPEQYVKRLLDFYFYWKRNASELNVDHLDESTADAIAKATTNGSRFTKLPSHEHCIEGDLLRIERLSRQLFESLNLGCDNVRNSYFDGSRDLETMDDLLVMNFIFTEKLLREHSSDDIVSELFPREHVPPLSEADSQCVATAVQLAKEKDGVKFRRFTHERSFSDWDDPLGSLFNEWCMTHGMWQYKVEDGNEGFKKMNRATYMYHYTRVILRAFFSRIGMRQELGDFFLLPWFGGCHYLTVVVSKMTKRDVKERHRAKDERELFFSMKVSLDLLMKANVKDPEVVGLLIRDSRIEFFTLKIQDEAMYFPRLLGIMEIPRDHTDFECLFEGLPVIMAARSIVSRTVAVKSCVPNEDPDLSILDNDSEHPLCRPSFYIED